MPNFDFKINLDKISQKNYNQKVKELETACRNFKEALLKEKLVQEKVFKKLFDENFEKQMSKKETFSRTSRVLHQISKNLSKFNGKINCKKMNSYIKAFKFTPRNAKKNNIKSYIENYINRSAIDNKCVVDFFNTQMCDILEVAITSFFDINTGVFTVRTEEDFKKVKDYSKNIQHVIIGDKIKKIDNEVFAVCPELKTVYLGKNCTEIGEAAFGACLNLKEINLAGVKTIGNNAFLKCPLKYVNLSNAEEVGSAFMGCSTLVNVILPKDDEKAHNVRSSVLSSLGLPDDSKKIRFINDPGY